MDEFIPRKVFIDLVNSQETKKKRKETSRSNLEEVEITMKLVKLLAGKKFQLPPSIGIVTPYKA